MDNVTCAFGMEIVDSCLANLPIQYLLYVGYSCHTVQILANMSGDYNNMNIIFVIENNYCITFAKNSLQMTEYSHSL